MNLSKRMTRVETDIKYILESIAIHPEDEFIRKEHMEVEKRCLENEAKHWRDFAYRLRAENKRWYVDFCHNCGQDLRKKEQEPPLNFGPGCKFCVDLPAETKKGNCGRIESARACVTCGFTMEL